MDALDIQPELSVSDIIKLLGQKTVMLLLKSLFEKNIVHISEEVNERYKPRKRTYLTLNPLYNDQEKLKELGYKDELIEYREYPDLGHQLSAQVLQDLCNWLEKVIPRV